MRSYLPHSHFPIFVEGKQGENKGTVVNAQ